MYITTPQNMTGKELKKQIQLELHYTVVLVTSKLRDLINTGMKKYSSIQTIIIRQFVSGMYSIKTCYETASSNCLCLVFATVCNSTHPLLLILSASSAPSSLYQTLHQCFSCLFCLKPLYLEWPSPSSPTKTLSGLIQIQPWTFLFWRQKTYNVFPYRTAVLLHCLGPCWRSV